MPTIVARRGRTVAKVEPTLSDVRVLEAVEDANLIKLADAAGAEDRRAAPAETMESIRQNGVKLLIFANGLDE